jgi:hypothetical protein
VDRSNLHEYSAAQLTTEVQTLVSDQERVPAYQPKPAPSTSGEDPAAPLSGALDPCVLVAQLGAATTSAPLAVDRGWYEGKPAVVVVLPDDATGDSVDVWVLADSCLSLPAEEPVDAEKAAVLAHTTVPR